MNKSHDLYHRIMYSPYLTSKEHRLHEHYLSVSQYQKERVILTSYIQNRTQNHILYHTEHIGFSMYGESLYAWTIGDPKLPRILCTAQHHGPENVGASFALYLSYLLIKDPMFTTWLQHHSFSFVPQQNPDALDVHGNWLWMKDPTWENFVYYHQYDPRQFDVEHGVAKTWIRQTQVIDDDSKIDNIEVYRSETKALLKWITRESEQYKPPIFYLSGHSWDILDAPLYLMYPHQQINQHDNTLWCTSIQKWSAITPYQSLATYAPLTEDYVLTNWVASPHINHGLYLLPTIHAFLEQNPLSKVNYSTLDFVDALNPSLRSMVVEPPIFSSPLFEHNDLATDNDLQALITSITFHDHVIQMITHAVPHSRSMTLDFFSRDPRTRHDTRLILELAERQHLSQRWQSILHTQSQQITMSYGQIKLATCNQYFHAGNLLALALRHIQNDQLQSSFDLCLESLSKFNLSVWPVSQGCFVYLSAVLSQMDLR